MKDAILNTHVMMCKRKGVNPDTTPIKVVPEMFYDNSSQFNQPLFDKVIAVAIVDKTQHAEERGALGQRYSISVNLFKNL